MVVSATGSFNDMDCLLIHCEGAEYGSYVLRSLTTAEFKYESAKEKLLGLHVESRGQQTMIFASVVDEPVDEHYDQDGSMLGSLMRLGTSINLESRLSVGLTSWFAT